MSVKLTDVFTTDGNVDQLKTPGKWYGKTVIIGTQTWMAENLNVTHYSNGDPIPCVLDNWESLTTGGYGVYDENKSYELFYGKLYNWYAVGTGNLAPDGWHVPTDAEWTTLTDYLPYTPGSKLADRQDLWDYSNDTLRNGTGFGTSGFNALPAGVRSNGDGGYYNIGKYAYFWSSTENGSALAYYRRLGYNYSTVTSNGDVSKKAGHSVRCIKD